MPGLLLNREAPNRRSAQPACLSLLPTRFSSAPTLFRYGERARHGKGRARKHSRTLDRRIRGRRVSIPGGPADAILNAADFGVPQDRHRFFLIGTREDQETVAKPPNPTVTPVPESEPAYTGSIPSTSSYRAAPRLADAIADLPNLNRFPSLLAADEVRLSSDGAEAMETSASGYARQLRGLDEDPNDLSHPRDWDKAVLTGSIRTHHTARSIRRFRATRPGETEPVSRFYRLDPQGLCNTLRAGSGSERGAFTSPRPLHPYLPRVLSNREAARLHSFPDWFRIHTTKWHGFRQIGNAVAPLVGRAVGQQVAAALGVRPVKPSQAIALGDLRLIEFTMSHATTYFGVDRAHTPPPRRRIKVDRPLKGKGNDDRAVALV